WLFFWRASGKSLPSELTTPREELTTMRLDTSMSQRMEQKMFLAPRMIQAMEILQLAVMALQERIEHELQENPVLELKEDNPEENPPTADELEEAAAEAAQCETADVASPEKELVIDDKGDNE